MRATVKNIILFIFPLVLAAGFLFLIPVEKKFSYHFVKGECENRASWIYSRIFERHESVDIVFSGASQTGCAIMDELVEKEINKLSEMQLNVVNLSFCRRGRDLQYSMLKTMFSKKQPKILILEVSEDEPKKSHPVFPYLASSSELWESFVCYNHRFLSSIWKGIIVRFEFLKFKLFRIASKEQIHFQKHGYLPSSEIVAPELIDKNRNLWIRRLSNPKPHFLRDAELNYSKHYIEKIVRLADQNNCLLLFLYLPESGSNLKEPLLYSYYQNLSELIVLPDSIISTRENWKDATHFNDSGAMQTSLFISNVLIDLICD